jgi:hypothetical protein
MIELWLYLLSWSALGCLALLLAYIAEKRGGWGEP